MAKKTENTFLDYFRLLSCGVVPILEKAIEKFKWHDEPRYSKVDVEKYVKALKATSHTGQRFVEIYSEWKREREQVIIELRKIAQNITMHHRNTNIAQLPASGLGITGGVLTIAGLLTVPLTGGVSLGLTIAGIILGVAGGATGLGATATDLGIMIDRSKKAKKQMELHQNRTEELSQSFEAFSKEAKVLDFLSTIAMEQVIQDIFIRHGGQASKTVIKGVKTISTGSFLMIKSLPSCCKAVVLMNRSVTGAENIATNIAKAAVKGTPAAASKVLKIAGMTFSAIGIAIEVITVVIAIYDLATGSETTTSKHLNKVADDLESEMKDMNKIYEKMKESSYDKSSKTCI